MNTKLKTLAGAVVCVALVGCEMPLKDNKTVVKPTSECCEGEPLKVQNVQPMMTHQAMPHHQTAMVQPQMYVNMQPQMMAAPMPMIPQAMPEKKKKLELMKISAVGYGAESTFASYTPGQRRLMAIRSSKLDAYRALAEQIDGIKIDSNTSVATLTARNDSFRARINAMVKGARVVSITPMADNNYETVMEVLVDRAFFEKAFVYTAEDQSQSYSPEDYYNIRSFQ